MTLSVLFAVPTAAEPPSHDDAILVLIPIVAPEEIAGDFDAIWRTELRVRNDSDQPVSLEALDCPIPCSIPANRERVLEETRFGEGIVLRVTPEQNEALHFSLRLIEGSDVQLNETELPVVRESELETGRLYLLGAPVRANQRVTLRHYLVDTDDPERFHTWLVAVNDSETGAALGSVFIGSTLASGDAPIPAEHPELDAGVTTLTSLFDLARERGSERVTIRISPLIGAGARYWAFLTIVDNETNSVELVTPQ